MVYLSLSRENIVLFECCWWVEIFWKEEIFVAWGMTSEKRAQEFHTDDVSLPRSGQCFWLVEVNFVPPIRSTTQMWILTGHQYGISALVSQTSLRGETSGGVAKCRLFCQANIFRDLFSNSHDSSYGNWNRRMLTRFSRLSRAWSSTLAITKWSVCSPAVRSFYHAPVQNDELTKPASFRTGKPVRSMLDRDEDMMSTGTRHPFLAKYKVIW